jgi:hypothetical protein
MYRAEILKCRVGAEHVQTRRTTVTAPTIEVLPDRHGLSQRGRFGNKMGTGLAKSAQCGYNVRAFGQCRNSLAIKAFKYYRNVFPIPRVWQTYRTQNPVG